MLASLIAAVLIGQASPDTGGWQWRWAVIYGQDVQVWGRVLDGGKIEWDHDQAERYVAPVEAAKRRRRLINPRVLSPMSEEGTGWHWVIMFGQPVQVWGRRDAGGGIKWRDGDVLNVAPIVRERQKPAATGDVLNFGIASGQLDSDPQPIRASDQETLEQAVEDSAQVQAQDHAAPALCQVHGEKCPDGGGCSPDAKKPGTIDRLEMDVKAIGKYVALAIAVVIAAVIALRKPTTPTA